MSIFVIDEHPLMREAIAATLRRLTPTTPITELDSLEAVTPAAVQHGTPALICVELLVGKRQGVSAVEDLKRQFAEVPIIVLSSGAPDQYEDLALEAGAQAYLHKSLSKAEISQTLRGFMPDAPAGEAAPVLATKLSKRQKQLLVLLDKGLSNRDIAELLQISEHTVKVHLWRLFRRLNVKSRSQASHLARTHNLLESSPSA
ncbi:MAG TPA: response regulator transcription factor [Hymenobacter sp.]|jgi:DNA-binding NarL/FixJ family response regulator